MENKELNLNELENAAGGAGSKKEKAGGSPTPLPYKEGYKSYKITATDTMIRIANRFNTTVDDLMRVNAQWIKNKSLIMTGYYMYVPENK